MDPSQGPDQSKNLIRLVFLVDSAECDSNPSITFWYILLTTLDRHTDTGYHSKQRWLELDEKNVR